MRCKGITGEFPEASVGEGERRKALQRIEITFKILYDLALTKRCFR